MEKARKNPSSICEHFSNENVSNSLSTDQSVQFPEVTYSENSLYSLSELTPNSASDHKIELTATTELAVPMDDVIQSAEMFFHFELFEENFVVDDSEFVLSIKTEQLIRITEKTVVRNTPDISIALPHDIVDTVDSNPILSVSTPRTPLTLADRDQLRAMIVLLNETNSVLLKIRQRFPLNASTRCDVIQCQIQMQLQELFGEFRSNDVVRFKEMVPQNRQAFISIWDHLSQLIVDTCYQQ